MEYSGQHSNDCIPTFSKMLGEQDILNLTQEQFNEIFIGGNPKVDDEENVKYKLYMIYKNLLKITELK